jgi:hypothetical protein
VNIDLNSLKDRTRNDYLSYKMSSAQLNEVTNQLRQVKTGELAPAAMTQDLVTLEQHPAHAGKDADAKKASLDFLGLRKTVASLPDDKPWTNVERATYRRLTTPEELVNHSKPQTHKGSDAYVDATTALFPKIDSDHNGELTTAEVDAAMAKKQFKGADAAALSTTRSNFDALAQLSGDKNGISKADLAMFRETGVGASTPNVNYGFQNDTAAALKMKRAAPIEQEHIDPMSIHQGSAGSCVLLSSSAGDSREALKAMFHTNDNGTINVHFKDGTDETVTDLTTSERLYHAQGDNGERWPGVLEMAMGEKLAAGTDKLPRTIINGIDRHLALKAVTGHDSKTVGLAEISVDQTRSLLQDELAKHAHIIADTCHPAPPLASDQVLDKLKNGVVDGHAYTVLGYDAKSDEVTVRNPWHQQEWVVNPDGKDDGVFKLPLKQFYSSYGYVTYTTTGKQAG